MSECDAVDADPFFLRLHELTQRFLQKRSKWVDLNEDTGGAGLCEYASHEVVGFMAEFGLEGEVLELWRREWFSPVSEPWSGQIEACEGYPGSPHFVAVFPHPDGRRVAVDITARQFGEDLPFPWIWASPSTPRNVPPPEIDPLNAVGGDISPLARDPAADPRVGDVCPSRRMPGTYEIVSHVGPDHVTTRWASEGPDGVWRGDGVMPFRTPHDLWPPVDGGGFVQRAEDLDDPQAAAESMDWRAFRAPPTDWGGS